MAGHSPDFVEHVSRLSERRSAEASHIVDSLKNFQVSASQEINDLFAHKTNELARAQRQVQILLDKQREAQEFINMRDEVIRKYRREMEHSKTGQIHLRAQDAEQEIAKINRYLEQCENAIRDLEKDKRRYLGENESKVQRLRETEETLKAKEARLRQIEAEHGEKSQSRSEVLHRLTSEFNQERSHGEQLYNHVQQLDVELMRLSRSLKDGVDQRFVSRVDTELPEVRQRVRMMEHTISRDHSDSGKTNTIASLKRDLAAINDKFNSIKRLNDVMLKRCIVLEEDLMESDDETSDFGFKDVIDKELLGHVAHLRDVFASVPVVPVEQPRVVEAAPPPVVKAPVVVEKAAAPAPAPVPVAAPPKPVVAARPMFCVHRKYQSACERCTAVNNTSVVYLEPNQQVVCWHDGFNNYCGLCVVDGTHCRIALKPPTPVNTQPPTPPNRTVCHHKKFADTCGNCNPDGQYCVVLGPYQKVTCHHKKFVDFCGSCKPDGTNCKIIDTPRPPPANRGATGRRFVCFHNRYQWTCGVCLPDTTNCIELPAGMTVACSHRGMLALCPRCTLADSRNCKIVVDTTLPRTVCHHKQFSDTCGSCRPDGRNCLVLDGRQMMACHHKQFSGFCGSCLPDGTNCKPVAIVYPVPRVVCSHARYADTCNNQACWQPNGSTAVLVDVDQIVGCHHQSFKGYCGSCVVDGQYCKVVPKP